MTTATKEKKAARAVASNQNGTEKTLIKVERSRTYKIVEPDEPKLLSDEFKVPDTTLGRVAKNYALLRMIEDEVFEDRAALGSELLEHFKKAKIWDIKFQLGKSMIKLEQHHIKAKDEIRVKKA